METVRGENHALVVVGSRPHPKSLFGQLLAIGALPLSISTAEGESHTRKGHSAIAKHINDRELRRLQLPSLLMALLPPAAPLEDQGGNTSGSSNDALPVQQQALVIRGAASLVLQQWLLLAADALQLLRRLLQPEKQHHRRSSSNPEQYQLLGRHQQQDSRRKRVKTAEAPREDGGKEQLEDADEAAEAIWEQTARLQLQQQHQQGEEESQQRLKRLGSVFATHLQEAESCVRASRDSAGLLLQRGGPDLFNACWAAVATPLRSGGTRPGQHLQQQQQMGSHERLLAAAGDAQAPGMSWRRWAFGGPDPHQPFPSAAAAASSAVAAAPAGKSASVAVAELAGERGQDAEVESADFADMWGPLPEEEQREDYEAQQQQQGEGGEAAQDIYAGPKASRRTGQGHGVQLDTNISRRTARISSKERTFTSLLSRSSTTVVPSRLRPAAKYLAATTFEVHELYAVHPVVNLYGWLQQQLLSGCKPTWNVLHTPTAAAAEGHSGTAGQALNWLSTAPGPRLAVAASKSKDAHQHSVGQGNTWPRREWEGDFTLYTEAELQQQQQQQQQDSSSSRRRSGDLLGGSEYVEVLRGIFDSSSMQQRATQTRLTQLPRESEASSTSRLGSSRRASGLSAPSSDASLEALAYGDLPDFDGCPTEFSDDQQQQQQERQQKQQNHLEVHGTAVASLRLRQLLQQYALTHPDLTGHLLTGGESLRAHQQEGQQQQLQQSENTIPLSRLLPRGRVDPRTACCTFSHLLLLHRHGSIKLKQLPQTLPMPSNNPYPEMFVHVTQQWRRADEAAWEHQQEVEEEQKQQQQEEEQQTYPEEQAEQQRHDLQQPEGSASGLRRTEDDKEVSSTSSDQKQLGEVRQQQLQRHTRGGPKSTGFPVAACRNRRSPRPP